METRKSACLASARAFHRVSGVRVHERRDGEGTTQGGTLAESSAIDDAVELRDEAARGPSRPRRAPAPRAAPDSAPGSAGTPIPPSISPSCRRSRASALRRWIRNAAPSRYRATERYGLPTRRARRHAPRPRASGRCLGSHDRPEEGGGPVQRIPVGESRSSPISDATVVQWRKDGMSPSVRAHHALATVSAGRVAISSLGNVSSHRSTVAVMPAPAKARSRVARSRPPRRSRSPACQKCSTARSKSPAASYQVAARAWSSRSNSGSRRTSSAARSRA